MGDQLCQKPFENQQRFSKLVISFLIYQLNELNHDKLNIFAEIQIGVKIKADFFQKAVYSIAHMSFQSFVKIDLYFEHSSLKIFLYLGIILLVFKNEGEIPEGKDWLERTAS